ncbi:hypothetical protein [Paenibacillus thalictri]|uniref:Uncharacterized protein n=1 Tax=Paenibacillus thalictri TaxID=2527873 RepID=A0A4Q9DHC1_9BACL|nr:hypothetical protein [Paenibacillus thalictri]TBL70110.1 hypothetical protein EYB31_34450 [Paenibacillus thalictri]
MASQKKKIACYQYIHERGGYVTQTSPYFFGSGGAGGETELAALKYRLIKPEYDKMIISKAGEVNNET